MRARLTIRKRINGDVISVSGCGKAGQKVPVGTGQGHVRIQAMTVGGTEV